VSPINAVIFDMDGLLIDTEPIWRQAEIEVFGTVGIHLTEEQCLETMGVRVAEVVALWHHRHPWEGPSIQEIADRIEDVVVAHVMAEGEAKAGVYSALATVRAAGLPIAIASSSSIRLIEAVVQRLGIADYIDAVCSGDAEPEGKPHPGVYLTTARTMDVAPEACLALEDSPNGVLAAKAAGMTCIAIPDPHLAGDPRMRGADLRLESLQGFTPQLLSSLQHSVA
jgi:HAD superfamily hydrolase (TIGR01509 family)